MYTRFSKTRLLLICLVSSIVVHMLSMYMLRMFGTYDFGAPVSPQAVMVDLTTPSDAPAPPSEAVSADATPADTTDADATGTEKKNTDDDTPEEADAAATAVEETEKKPAPVVVPEAPQPAPPPEEDDAPRKVRVPRRWASVAAKPTEVRVAKPVPRPIATAPVTPRPAAIQFPSASYEKLSYAITMLGVTLGSAEIESKNEQGLTTISLRVKSNTAIDALTGYPVDDVIETRHIDGVFIETKIQQLEGSFKSDEMFIINRWKQRVSWMDMMRNRSAQMSLPSSDVLDTLSGIYFLRTRQLEVGKTETLHIYDSEVYADVPVEVLRREEMRLPNFTKVKTLVVRPQQNTPGIFRRTGEVLIWLTDDEFKVPVRIETSVAIGKVTAELVSAESKPHADPAQPGPAPPH